MPKQENRAVFFELRRKDLTYRGAKDGLPRGITCSPHFHREIELLFLLRGHVTAYADATRVELEPGDVFLSFPNQLHYFTSEEDKDSYMLFIFKPDLVPEYLEQFLCGTPASPLIKGVGNSPRINTLLHLLLDSEEQARPTSADGDEQRLAELDLYRKKRRSGYLLALMSELLPRMTVTESPGRDHSSLRDVITYCTEHFSEQISLTALEEALHLNKYYISHLLSDKLGVRFNDYVNFLRIAEACRLLTGTEHSVIEISEQVGFNTLRTFNRAFIKQTGVTPSAYRREQGGSARLYMLTDTGSRLKDFLPSLQYGD